MPTIQIESARQEDLDEIMSLELLGFPPGIIERADVFLGRIKFFPEGFLVAREPSSGKTIGYICSEIWTRHDVIEEGMFTLNHGIEKTHNHEGAEIYISSMTIHPDHRGQGMGGVLFSTCINNLRKLQPNINSAVLIVNETWKYAKQIYEREGFVELFRIEGFFTPDGTSPQAAIVMRRQLDNALI